jgi:cysteine-rich repeat protein
VGTLTGILVSVTDGDVISSLTPFDLTVMNVNDAPTISGTPPASATEDVVYTFTPIANDVDVGDTLSFSMTNAPAWLSINGSTGVVSGTPTNADVGTHPGISISVTDESLLSASLDSFDITVTNVNDAPTISGSPNLTATEDIMYTFTPVASDVDEIDNLSFSINKVMAVDIPWATFSMESGTLGGTPANADVGLVNDIVITVTDSSGASESLASFDITVVNEPLEISGSPETTATEDETYVTFIPTVTDLVDVESFSIQDKPTWAAFDSLTGELSGTPGNADVGNHPSITISVTDGNDTSTLSPFDIFVTNVNDPPEIGGTLPGETLKDVAFSFVPTVVDIDPSDSLVFSIENQPTWNVVAFDSATGTLSGTPDGSDLGIHDNIRITVSDGTATDTVAFSISVVAEGYEGFGSVTNGADDCPTGPITVHVTNLADSGPGSFREAVSDGCRKVVFDVGGTITLTSTLNIPYSYITIDGASAPAPGITLSTPNVRTSFEALGGIGPVHDIIMHHIRTVGSGIGMETKDIWEMDGGAHDVYNIILDHNTLEASSDGAFDIWGRVHDVTISWNLFKDNELMMHAIPADEETRENISFHHNTMAGNNERQIMVRGDTEVDYVNNVIYGWGWMVCAARGLQISTFLDPDPRLNVEDNVFHYVPGLACGDTHGPVGPNLAIVFPDGKDTEQLYFNGNVFPAAETGAVSTAPRLPIPAYAEVSRESAMTLGDTVVPCAGTHYPTAEELTLLKTVSQAIGGNGDACATAPVAPPVCGNSTIEEAEQCDDGNTLDNDGCTAACLVEEQCYDAGNTFSFFSWGDSYTSAGEVGVQQLFHDVVDSKKYPDRLIPRMWLSVGDIPFMVDGIGRLDQLNSHLSNSKTGQNYPFSCTASTGEFPYFVAVGNHDVDGYQQTTPAEQYDYWENVVGPKLPDTLLGIQNFSDGPADAHDGRTTYSFDYKNVHFVVVNQYHGDPDYPNESPTACIRQDIHDWVDQDLGQTNKPFKFVFGHTPIWSYCSTVGGYGGEYCPIGHPDNQDPPNRTRLYDPLGIDWWEPFGRHWADQSPAGCPPNSKRNYWAMLANHGVIAHYVGHTHTYSSRLVEGDGTRRNDISAYAKTGESFVNTEGVWEVDHGIAHNSAGTTYVLTIVTGERVTYEAYDRMGINEPFRLVETWSISVPSIKPTNAHPAP